MTTTGNPIPDAPDRECCAHASAFEILSTCHEHIGQRLALLEDVARDLAQSDGLQERHLARLGDVLAFLDTAIPIHSADEEQSLFPRLRECAPFAGVTGTPMDCMESEHVEHGALKARLKTAIVKRDPAAAARLAMEIVREYRSHISKEEDVLYPMARQILTDSVVLDTMTAEMRGRRQEAGLLEC